MNTLIFTWKQHPKLKWVRMGNFTLYLTTTRSEYFFLYEFSEILIVKVIYVVISRQTEQIFCFWLSDFHHSIVKTAIVLFLWEAIRKIIFRFICWFRHFRWFISWAKFRTNIHQIGLSFSWMYPIRPCDFFSSNIVILRQFFSEHLSTYKISREIWNLKKTKQIRSEVSGVKNNIQFGGNWCRTLHKKRSDAKPVSKAYVYHGMNITIDIRQV